MNALGENWVLAYLKERYGGEPYRTQIHVLVHAIHAVLHCGFLRGEIEELKFARAPDYVRSWEIIERQGGPFHILKEFTSWIREKKSEV
ncbi:hypothetical protein HKBW3S47_02152 [Candidatus Hakubella thermalkaliphila]|uniref:Uncharacterized protein n=2 Tax=Candidatus Hakubella thermalkaliphila TaxID=2754717 RepID=A0A6V8QAN3_9ACTN|nr:hypothetical protein HKBW3S47_02152 [Candidatus Hakubella thermalkaliphila]